MRNQVTDTKPTSGAEYTQEGSPTSHVPQERGVKKDFFTLREAANVLGLTYSAIYQALRFKPGKGHNSFHESCAAFNGGEDIHLIPRSALIDFAYRNRHRISFWETLDDTTRKTYEIAERMHTLQSFQVGTPLHQKFCCNHWHRRYLASTVAENLHEAWTGTGRSSPANTIYIPEGVTGYCLAVALFHLKSPCCITTNNVAVATEASLQGACYPQTVTLLGGSVDYRRLATQGRFVESSSLDRVFFDVICPKRFSPMAGPLFLDNDISDDRTRRALSSGFTAVTIISLESLMGSNEGYRPILEQDEWIKCLRRGRPRIEMYIETPGEEDPNELRDYWTSQWKEYRGWLQSIDAQHVTIHEVTVPPSRFF